MNNTRIKEAPLVVFGILWIIFIFLDFWNKHPFYELSFEYFHFPKLGGFLILYILGLAALFHYGKNRKLNLFTKIAFVLVCFIVVALATTTSFMDLTDGQNNFLSSITFVGNALKYLLGLMFIFTSVFSTGYLALKIVDFDIRETSRPIYSMVIGIMILTFAMFVLAIFGGLYQMILIALLIIPIVLNFKFFIKRFKGLFQKSNGVKTSEINYLTGILFGLLMAFIVINFLGSMAPFPLGFDSRNYYVNISKLLQDYNGLVEGFQSYTWSIFMSLGNIAFKSITLTLLISFSGILLTLWGIWELCRNYFRFSINYSLLAVLMILLVPSVFNQMYVEHKIDFGLLFVQICSVLLLIDIVDKIRGTEIVRHDKELVRLMILLGVFFGFALGIKATHLYMIFSIMILLWTIYCGYVGFLASFFLVMFVIFIAKLDEVSGLNAYHLGISYLKYVMLGLSLLFFGWAFVKNKTRFFDSIKTSVILSLVSLFVFLPWVIKNFTESKKPTINSLIMGENPGPDLNLRKVIENYEKTKGNE